MLKPIPAKIMRSTATVRVASGHDRYQNPTYTDYIVKKVHLQPTNEIRKTANNTDCTLRSILFADKRSIPALEWWKIFSDSHDKGIDAKVIVRGVEYTVFSVDELRDDTDEFHHWEIGLE